MKKYFLLSLFYIFVLKSNLIASQHQSCLVLLDHLDTENIGRTSSFYLNCKLQSAIAEKAVPILVHTSLWNSFMERRVYFMQKALQKDTEAHKVLTLYNDIKNKLMYWSNYYNRNNKDIIQNKLLVAQRINQEFYNSDYEVVDSSNQLLLNYLTPFDPQEWLIYKKSGFFLFIPKNYLITHPQGFKIDQLEQVHNPQDIALNYFESQRQASLPRVLSDFFPTHNDFDDPTSPYKWNIVLSGHGGSLYIEKNEGKTISWHGEPLIADLKLQEFKEMLEFFQTQLNTHVLHYSSCYAGGNHIELAFENTYHFAIICECLTDCATYCNWSNTLPSKQKILSIDDLYYDPVLKSWDLNMKSPYHWDKFFNEISEIDFSLETIDYLPETLKHITYPIIANISLLRLPKANQFYPVTSPGCVKVDEQFILLEKENQSSDRIFIHEAKTLLVESVCIDCDLSLNNHESLRIISIKPGKAEHYLKKLVLNNPADLFSVFWQAEFQLYDKTFLIDQCVFSPTENSATFDYLKLDGNNIVIEKVLITQQNTFFGHHIRLFFTINDTGIMVVAKKSNELHSNTTVQEVFTLSGEGKSKYEDSFNSLKEFRVNPHLR